MSIIIAVDNNSVLKWLCNQCLLWHSDGSQQEILAPSFGPWVNWNRVLVMFATIVITDPRAPRNCLELNSSKKVWKLVFHRSYFSYYHISNIVFDIIRKPVYLSLNWYHICSGYEIMGSIQWSRVSNEILQSIVYSLNSDSLEDENNRSFPAGQH